MFKKILIGLTALAVLAVVSTAEARYTNCANDARVQNSDCNSSRSFSVNCCPKGYRVQGVAYTDHGKTDHMDAISPICRHVKKGNDMMPSDFGSQPVIHMCKKTEIMIGLACKDSPKGGDTSDVSDGCTAICQNPKTKKERMIYSSDLEGNGRPYAVTKIYLPNRITGIHYKDMTKKVKNTDYADCATVSYKHQPIVK